MINTKKKVIQIILKSDKRRIGKLPHFFSLKSASDLVRIGGKNDGGYLVSQSDIDKSDVLLSLGIGYDWNFEKDFIARKDVPLYAYDASTEEKSLLLNAMKRGFIFKPSMLIKYFDYKNFFSKPNNRHIKKFVSSACDSDEYCTMSSIFNALQQQNIFLKIDIEGSEYRFLDTLIANQDRINGLVLELHDCDLHLHVIKNFIDKFDLKLVHIHANSACPILLDNRLPTIMELTFSKNCTHLNEALLPHPLDSPNRIGDVEINLVIESE